MSGRGLGPFHMLSGDSDIVKEPQRRVMSVSSQLITPQDQADLIGGVTTRLCFPEWPFVRQQRRHKCMRVVSCVSVAE